MNQPSKKRAIIFGSYIFSLINFRKNLLVDLVAAGYEVLALAPGSDHKTETELNKIGVRFQSISLARTGFNPLDDVRTIREFNALIKSFQPDLLITYTIKPVIYGNLVASYYQNVKTLALITGLGYLDTGVRNIKKRMVQSMIHRLYQFALRKIHYVAFQNPDDQQYFKDHNLLRGRTDTTVTAGSGVDLSHYPKVQPVMEPVTFLLIARLIRAKGIIQYMEAATQLKKQYREKVSFQLIGLIDENNPDSITESQLDDMVQGGIIDYLGFQADVRPHLAKCSVFVLPSYYREGTPRTILEALAMGKAIITTDNPGCRETVVAGSNGYLIAVKDTGALMRAMEQFIDTPERIATMGEASFAMATNKYDVRLVNKHLFTFAKLS
jgi:glycosyltransferase involved in cell wall biosynthesis